MVDENFIFFNVLKSWLFTILLAYLLLGKERKIRLHVLALLIWQKRSDFALEVKYSMNLVANVGHMFV